MTPDGERVRRSAADAKSEAQRIKTNLSNVRRHVDRIDRKILQDRRYSSPKNDVDYSIRSAERALNDLITKLDGLGRAAQ